MTAYGIARAAVHTVTDLSANFRRIVFSGPELDGLRTDGPFYDQRIKLIFPSASGRLPVLGSDPDWYRAWRALPDDDRGVMRTYSIRSAGREDGATFLAVDFVLHGGDGASGPAADWAASARPGNEVLIIAPQQGAESAGIEFDRGAADDVVLLGDETAAPAIARILEDLERENAAIPGTAYIEVPTSDDRLRINGPSTFGIEWLPRDGSEHGERLASALGWHMCERAEPDRSADGDLIWETPAYSAAGEELSRVSRPSSGTYYWIAGESGVVRHLRRCLVRDFGIDRSQVAFMGYWREGVAMKG